MSSKPLDPAIATIAVVRRNIAKTIGHYEMTWGQLREQTLRLNSKQLAMKVMVKLPDQKPREAAAVGDASGKVYVCDHRSQLYLFVS